MRSRGESLKFAQWEISCGVFSISSARQPEVQDPNKLNWLQNWDEGEGTNILSIAEIIGVAGLFCKFF